MMRVLRTAVFGLAEGVRLYLGATRRTPSDSSGRRQEARPVGAELVRGVESGRG
jgi:hypothetical protein